MSGQGWKALAGALTHGLHSLDLVLSRFSPRERKLIAQHGSGLTSKQHHDGEKSWWGSWPMF